MPGPKELTADNGTMASADVLTAAAEDALLRPVLAMALRLALRAESLATALAVVAVEVERTVVPATGPDDCVPVAAPPDLLT